MNNKTARSHPHLIAHCRPLSLLTLFSNLITSAVPCVTALHYISNTLYSLLSKSFKCWRQIERQDRDSWLSRSLEQAKGSWIVHVRLGGIGYGWNGGSKCGSSEAEFCHSYDVVHQIRIIQMHVWLDDSQPVTNVILERRREACQEHNIVLCFR